MRRLPEGPVNLVVRRRRKKEEEEETPPEWRDRLLIKTRTTHFIFPLISKKNRESKWRDGKLFLLTFVSGPWRRRGIKEFLFLSSSDGSNCSEEEKIGFSFLSSPTTTVIDSHKLATFPYLMFRIASFQPFFQTWTHTHIVQKWSNSSSRGERK